MGINRLPNGPEVRVLSNRAVRDFPGGTVVKNPPASAGDMDSIPGLGRPTCHGTAKPVSHNY